MEVFSADRERLSFDTLVVIDQVAVSSDNETLCVDGVKPDVDKDRVFVNEDGCDSESDLELVCDRSIDDDAVALETL